MGRMPTFASNRPVHRRKRFLSRTLATVLGLALASTSLASLSSLLTASPASGVTGYRVAKTGGIGLNMRSGPGTGFRIVGSLREGAPLDIACQTTGENIRGSVIWDRLANGAYVSDF